jgi:hypothetical protein
MTPPKIPDDFAALQRDIIALDDKVATLNRHLVILIKNRVQEEVADVTIPRAELTDRLRRSFWRVLAITVAVALLLVVVNRVTLVQAQRQSARRITNCFLQAGTINAAQAARCDRLFSDGAHSYLKLQQRSRQNIEVFVKLQQRVKHLEDEVAKLKE